MSLVLNGGVNGTASTQYAHVDARIVTTLPVTLAVWFKHGTNSSAGGRVVRWADKDATLGTYVMGGSVSRSTGPVLTRQITSRVATAPLSTAGTNASYQQSVTGIAAGASTVVTVTDGSAFTAGEYVQLAGDFTGLTGITSGRDWRISSVAGDNLTLELASSGTWGDSLSATVKWSAWQPEKWNLMVCSFETTNPRLLAKGGFFGQSAVSIDSTFAGTSTQFPTDIFSVLDRVCVGADFQSGSAGEYFRGEIAHIALWDNKAATAGEAAELLTVAPNLVSWGSPAAYWPLLADENDDIGSNHLTLVGSPTINSDGPSITLSGGGGGTPGFLPQIMRARNPSIFGVR